MNALSLFSGIGGIDLAGEWAGIKTVAMCEREPFCQKVLQKNFPRIPIYDDVCTLTKERLEANGIGTIDLIHGGYPCQPFSTAGNRKGESDDRYLWPEVKRLLQEIRPRWFVGENVAGHITLGLDDVLSDLEEIDYTAQVFVIPACAINAKHQRKRVFIVAYSDSNRDHSEGEHRDYRDRAQGDKEWRESQSESANRGQAMANTKSSECEFAEHPRRRLPRLTDYGQNVADSESERRGEERECIGRSASWTAGSSSLADSECGGMEGSRRSGQSEYSAQDGDGQTDRPSNDSARTAQSGLGGSSYEFSDWLDRCGVNPLDSLIDFITSYPQPALMNQHQYEWEPPRVTTKVKNRAARLKAIGNAVDPLQVFPILYAIKLIDDNCNYQCEVSICNN